MQSVAREKASLLAARVQKPAEQVLQGAPRVSIQAAFVLKVVGPPAASVPRVKVLKGAA